MTKKETILSISVVALLLFGFISYNKLTQLEDRMNSINQLSYDLRDVNHSVHNISSQVDARLNQFLQEHVWIPDKSYQVVKVDLENNNIDVMLQWQVRELSNDEEIKLMLRNKKESEWTELNVDSDGGLNYSLTHQFSLLDNYETQVIAISESGKRTESLLSLNFQEQLDQRIQIYGHIHHHRTDVSLDVDIHNHMEHSFLKSSDINDLKMKSAKAIVYVDGSVFKEINLLKDHDHFHSDRYGESLYYHAYFQLQLDEDRDEERYDIEVKIIVEDGIGFIYETIADSRY